MSTWRGATEATGLRVGVPRLLVGRLIAIDLSPLKKLRGAYCACDNSTSPQPTEKRTAAEQWANMRAQLAGRRTGLTLEDIMGPARSVEQTRCESETASGPLTWRPALVDVPEEPCAGHRGVGLLRDRDEHLPAPVRMSGDRPSQDSRPVLLDTDLYGLLSIDSRFRGTVE